jgi:L-lactate dehydrogenase complex protein LldG|uniref:Lactate utilization protein n=1 Tax=Desulfobacca acetoxidans TaxID=60893 RepID=A0A7V6A5S6_9BACT
MEAQTDLKLFKEKAAAVQVVISEIAGVSEAFDYAADLTAKQGGRVMAAFGWEGQDRVTLEAACGRAGVSLVTGNLREHAATLHTALTLADWGIADTGSLVLDSSSEDLRLATMLAEIHVAVLPLSRLKPDAFALEDELNRLLASPPRYLTFITGASRTADIERVLTIGVHGPGELHVLLLKDQES